MIVQQALLQHKIRPMNAHHAQLVSNKTKWVKTSVPSVLQVLSRLSSVMKIVRSAQLANMPVLALLVASTVPAESTLMVVHQIAPIVYQGDFKTKLLVKHAISVLLGLTTTRREAARAQIVHPERCGKM
jgi:hypothetical protein